MSNRTQTVIFNGRLLPDDAPVDFVLWARDRDFEIVDSGEDGEAEIDRDGGISGWFFAPDPV